MTYLRFGTRDLLWAMMVVGLAVGWWNETRHSWRRADAEWRELYRLGLMDDEPKGVRIEYTNWRSASYGQAVIP